MIKNILPIICLCLCVLGCAHCHPKQKTFIFKDTETEKTVEYLRGKIKLDPNDIDSQIRLSRIFLNEGMPEEAIPGLEKAISTESRNIQAYLLLSYALQKCPRPDLDKVTNLLEKACQLAPGNADAHLNLAQAYEKSKKEEKAIREFDQAIGLTNDEATLVSAHLGLMAIYKKLGQAQKAMAEYEAARKIHPAVEEMIKEAEISQITPAPQYGGGELTTEEDGIHPVLEERIKKIRQEINKIAENKK